MNFPATIDFSKIKSRAQLEEEITKDADYFTACVFLGRAKYHTIRSSTLEEAFRMASSLYIKYGRPVMIYAVRGSLTAHITNYDPRTRK